MLSVHEGNAVAIVLPQKVTLEIVEDRARSQGTDRVVVPTSPPCCRNGVRTNIPPFHRHRHARRGDDRGWLLRRAREGLSRALRFILSLP